MRDSDTTFKVKRLKVKVARPLYSARPQRVRQVQRWPWALGVGNYCYVASARRRATRWGAHGGEERGGGISCRHAHSLFCLIPCSRLVQRLRKCWQAKIKLQPSRLRSRPCKICFKAKAYTNDGYMCRHWKLTYHNINDVISKSSHGTPQSWNWVTGSTWPRPCLQNIQGTCIYFVFQNIWQPGQRVR